MLGQFIEENYISFGFVVDIVSRTTKVSHSMKIVRVTKRRRPRYGPHQTSMPIEMFLTWTPCASQFNRIISIVINLND